MLSLISTHRIGTAVSLLCLTLSGLTQSGCSKEIETPNDLMSWIGDADHGLVRTASAHGIRWSATYLPSHYLAARHLESLNRFDHAMRDSILADYDNSLCFLLTVSPEDPSDTKDVVARDAASSDEVNARTMALTFDVKELATLRYGGVSTPAVISTLESTLSTSNRREVMVLFAKDAAAWSRADTLELELDDRIFRTGAHLFRYAMENVHDAPALAFEATDPGDDG